MQAWSRRALQCDLGQVAELVCTKGTVAVATTPQHHRRELCEQRTRQLIETLGQNTQPSPRPVSSDLSDFCCSGQAPAPVYREPVPRDDSAPPGVLARHFSTPDPAGLPVTLVHLLHVALPAPAPAPSTGPAGGRDRAPSSAGEQGRRQLQAFFFHSVVWTERVSPPTDRQGSVDERHPLPQVLGE